MVLEGLLSWLLIVVNGEKDSFGSEQTSLLQNICY